MAVYVPIEEIAVNDYSSEYGTVSEVVDEGESITLTFIDGNTINRDKGEELEVDQGGRF